MKPTKGTERLIKVLVKSGIKKIVLTQSIYHGEKPTLIVSPKQFDRIMKTNEKIGS